MTEIQYKNHTIKAIPVEVKPGRFLPKARISWTETGALKVKCITFSGNPYDSFREAEDISLRLGKSYVDLLD